MPSRLIQLNGMNVNAGGMTEFRASMQPCDQHEMSVCNFDHVKKVAACISLKRSKVFSDQASDAPTCMMGVLHVVATR